VGGMNATEIILLLLALASFVVFSRFSLKLSKGSSGSRTARLARIRKASFLFQWVIGISLVFAVYAVVAFLCGWPFFSQGPARLVVTHNHIYTSPAELPDGLLPLVLMKVGLDLAAVAVMYALFGLYRRGILFSARNVLYIRFQGYYLILGYCVDYALQSTLRDMDLNTTPVFVGLLIIFVAWIMDEGRKIQEEQELTV
jgi:hypothetical protein